jgi:HJR/Mrr/RecB family endonuclease
MEINPLKIGPFLLCFHNEERSARNSEYWRLHDDLKEKYDFFITNTSVNIAESQFLQDRLKSFVAYDENHCYILSNASFKFFYEDINSIMEEFLLQKKDFSHLAVIKIDNVAIDQTKLAEQVRLFDLTNGYQSEFEKIARYFVSVIENPIIRFDLKKHFHFHSIIQVCKFVDSSLIERFLDNPSELLRIDRNLFEKLVAEIFDGFGYAVELTKKTRDGGCDIIAIKDQQVLVKYLIECKRPDIGNKVGIKPVRELYAVKVHKMATKAILATTASFTKDAQLFFEKHRWELEGKDFDGLMDWIQEYMKLIEKSDRTHTVQVPSSSTLDYTDIYRLKEE